MAAKEINVEVRGNKYRKIGGVWYVWSAPRGRSTSTEYRWCVVPSNAYLLFGELETAAEQAA